MATPTANTRKTPNAPAYVGSKPKVAYVWASTRIVLGFIFVWAFLDKLLGLGYSTPAARAWINGGSPTNGFLANTKGWFAGAFQAIAGHPVTDALFMVGLAAVGVALLLGIGMRIAAASGALMMVLMYLAALPGVPATTNPVVDDHIVYALVLVALAMTKAGATLGFGKSWRDLAIVKKYPVLE